MTMRITIFLTLLAGVSVYFLYQLADEVQKLDSDLKKLQAGIEKNKESIRVLNAEWAYTNRPDNLQRLAAKHLPLLLVAPYQVAEITDLPARSTDAFATGVLAVPVPRARSRNKRTTTALPVGSLHMATFTRNGQSRKSVE